MPLTVEGLMKEVPEIGFHQSKFEGYCIAKSNKELWLVGVKDKIGAGEKFLFLLADVSAAGFTAVVPDPCEDTERIVAYLGWRKQQEWSTDLNAIVTTWRER